MAYGTYGMSSTPMISPTMPNPMGVTSVGMNRAISMSQPMTTAGLQAGTVRNMNLPLSSATPIQVTEITPNLEEIQNFPVAGRGLDGTHFHQDPVSGQMYVMTEEFHMRIPDILDSRTRSTVNDSVERYLTDLVTYQSKPENLVTDTIQPFNASTINSKDIMESTLGLVSIRETGTNLTVIPNTTITISPNVNIPGAPTQTEKIAIQSRIQNSVNNRPLTRTSDTQTRQVRMGDIFSQIVDTNKFSSVVTNTQINSFTLKTDNKINHPVNNFSTISGIGVLNQNQSNMLSTPMTNTFETGITTSTIPSVSTVYSKLLTNTFHAG